jgi:hypothetical protein
MEREWRGINRMKEIVREAIRKSTIGDRMREIHLQANAQVLLPARIKASVGLGILGS